MWPRAGPPGVCVLNSQLRHLSAAGQVGELPAPCARHLPHLEGCCEIQRVNVCGFICYVDRVDGATAQWVLAACFLCRGRPPLTLRQPSSVLCWGLCASAVCPLSTLGACSIAGPASAGERPALALPCAQGPHLRVGIRRLLGKRGPEDLNLPPNATPHPPTPWAASPNDSTMLDDPLPNGACRRGSSQGQGRVEGRAAASPPVPGARQTQGHRWNKSRSHGAVGA